MMNMNGRQLLIVALLAALLAGCESLDDLGNLSDGLTPTTPSEAARQAVDPTDADNRREGVILLSNATFGGVEAYVKLYRDVVDNERDPIVKAAAIQALGRHGEPADAMRITPHLSHVNQQVRWASAKALQRLHNAAAVPELLRVLRDENEDQDVRIASAIALGQYPEDRVFHGLVDALAARELAINDAAERSLHALTGQSFNMSAPDWLGWYNTETASRESASVFAGQEEYLYPVYSRKVKWWEKIAFWSPKVFEQPAPPIGLRPEGGRRTYEDSDVRGEDSASAQDTTQPVKRSTYDDQ
jgi:hypothetical protein